MDHHIDRWRRAWGALVLGWAIGPGAMSAQAQDVLAVGTTFPRVFAPNAQGQPEGLAVDLLRRALERDGLTLRFEFLPWMRAQALVEAGRAQVLIGPYRTPEREARFHFTDTAFYADAMVLYGRKGQAAWGGDMAALKGQRVAKVAGWAYGEVFDKAAPSMMLSTPQDVAAGVRMLQLGRVDWLATNQRNTEPVLKLLGLADELQVSGPPLTHMRGHFATPRDAAGEQLRQSLDAGLRRLRANGEWRELAQRWGVLQPD